MLLPHCDSFAKANRLVSDLAASGGVLPGGRGGSFSRQPSRRLLQKKI